MIVDQKQTTESQRNNRPLIATLVGCCLLLIAVWLSTTLVAIGMYKGDLTKASQLGDVYGVANSLFSALAFGGIIVTIWLQSNELRLQRRELRMQRRESKRQRQQMEKSAIAQEKSEKALKLQADSLLLSAYLSALGSVRESYARSGSNADLDEERNIRHVMAGIAEQIAPRIQHIAERTMKEHAPNPTKLTQEQERRHVLANRINGIGRKFSVKWKSKLEPGEKLRAHFAYPILGAVQGELESISNDVPAELVDIFVSPLAEVQRLINELNDDNPEFVVSAGSKGHAIVASIESVATIIANSVPTSDP